MSTTPPMSPNDSPQGTIVIVAVFGAFLVLGWLALFFGLFVPRGAI